MLADAQSHSLAAIAANPELIETLTADQAKALLPLVAILTVGLSGRVVSSSQGQPELPTLIDVKALSKILGKSPDFIYEHSRTWPFSVRLSSRDLMFDVAKLNRWLSARTGATK